MPLALFTQPLPCSTMALSLGSVLHRSRALRLPILRSEERWHQAPSVSEPVRTHGPTLQSDCMITARAAPDERRLVQSVLFGAGQVVHEAHLATAAIKSRLGQPLGSSRPSATPRPPRGVAGAARPLTESTPAARPQRACSQVPCSLRPPSTRPTPAPHKKCPSPGRLPSPAAPPQPGSAPASFERALGYTIPSRAQSRAPMK